MKLTKIAVLAALVITAMARSRSTNSPGDERFIGAWRLTSIAGLDGKPVAGVLPQGMLIYTRDGHVSVQLMYSKADVKLSNEYVQNGYEASFGTYDIDAAAHTVTHHVQASITRDLLVGKNLPRIYRFTGDGRLIIKSAHPEEHWSVTWERY